MGRTVQLRKVLDLRETAPGLVLQNLCVDWHGDPVLLFDEGREAFPVNKGTSAISRWYKTIPTAHHIFRIRQHSIERLRIPNNGKSLLTRFSQPLGGGWLLTDSRGGNARVMDATGEQIAALNLGDAIEDVQTTSDNLIWTSYFDEGVFGGGIGKNGLVCFDATGDVKLEFATLAEASGLSHIDDCYALNVCDEEVWISYYSDFPLVRLKDFKVHQTWKAFGSFKAFSVRKDELFCINAYGPRSLSIINLKSGARDDYGLLDERGTPIDSSLKLSVAGRLDKLYLYSNDFLFEVP